MTPSFWHRVALRIEPYKNNLAYCAGFGLFLILGLLTIAAIYQLSNKWLFLGLWASNVIFFWCFGLLLVNSLYKKLPQKTEGTLEAISYYWNLFVGWYGAVFLVVWFLLLIAATLFIPVLLFSPNVSNAC